MERDGGGFVLVVGPSGAGKDTLIGLARDALGGDPAFLFPRRIVTRGATAWEDHDSVDPAAFERDAAAGRYALHWRAHGLGYAIPGLAERAARAGQVAVCNVSRGVVAEARARLPRVSVVEVTAAPEVLAQRLAARNRATDGDLAARLARAVPDWSGADLVIRNENTAAAAAALLLSHLRSRLTLTA